MFAGNLAAAAPLAQEAQATADATGSNLAPYATLGLAAWRGREDEAAALIEITRKEAVLRGDGTAMTLTNWANAVLYNGLARYREALAAAERGSEHPGELGLAAWSGVELVEAAVRAGEPERAAGVLPRLAESASIAGTDWALGMLARSRALLAGGELAGGELAGCTGRRSSGSAAPASRPNWPGRTCSTASGCAVITAAGTPASSSGPPTGC